MSIRRLNFKEPKWQANRIKIEHNLYIKKE